MVDLNHVIVAGGLLVVGAGAGLWDAYEESQAKRKKEKINIFIKRKRLYELNGTIFSSL